MYQKYAIVSHSDQLHFQRNVIYKYMASNAYVTWFHFLHCEGFVPVLYYQHKGKL